MYSSGTQSLNELVTAIESPHIRYQQLTRKHPEKKLRKVGKLDQVVEL